MKIATLNVNSVRMRLDAVLEWLAANEPDVLGLQETKCADDKFPRFEFEEMGWNVEIYGQKSYNGVALVSRHPIQNVRRGFEDPRFPEDCRLIEGAVGGVTVVNTYVPNGTVVGSDKFDYKLRWLERLLAHFETRHRPDEPIAWLGDMNIAPTPDDVWESRRHLGKVGHHPDEFARLAALVSWGFEDVFRRFHAGPGHYTFWDYVIPRSFDNNLGWRIDHIYATPGLAARATACTIDRSLRQGDKPSDHTAVIAEFDLDA